MKADFNEFPPKSRSDWEQQVMKELKGKPLSELMKHPIFPEMSPIAFEKEGQTPWMSTSATLKTARPFGGWGQVAAIDTQDLPEARDAVLEQLGYGADGILLDLELKAVEDFQTLFEEVQVEILDIHFRGKAANLATLQSWVKFLKERKLSTKNQGGSMAFDLAMHHSELSERIGMYDAHFSLFKPLMVDVSHWQNEGGKLEHELALSLHKASSVLEAGSRAHAVDSVASSMGLQLSVGQHYLPEIAKFRALRLLWKAVVEQFEPEHSCSTVIQIGALTSTWKYTARDERSNLLRATTAAMSAIVGGADFLQIEALSASYRNPSASHKRLAMNIHHILRFESYLDQVDDPSRGSFYLERLTEKLADGAWEHLKEIESMDAAEASTYWQNTLKADRLASEKEELLGVSFQRGELPDAFSALCKTTLESQKEGGKHVA